MAGCENGAWACTDDVMVVVMATGLIVLVVDGGSHRPWLALGNPPPQSLLPHIRAVTVVNHLTGASA